MVPVSSRRPFRRWVVFPVLLAVLLFAGLRFLHAQAEPSEAGPIPTGPDVAHAHFISNDTIVRMTKAGLDDTIILQTIETQPGRYSTAPNDLIALKNAGVSQQVIAAMQAHSAGLALHAANSVESAPLARGIDDIGVYYQSKSGEWLPLKTEIVEFKSGGWVKSAFTNNIVKQDLNGDVDHRQSTLVLPTGVHILIYAPAGTEPQEYDLVRFRVHAHRREFRVKTGGVFHSETGSQRDDIVFHPHKVAPQMYAFTVPVDIQKGEYGVLPPGSSNPRGISNAGKIFTFSIRE